LGNLKTFSGAALCKLLQQHGFAEVRQKGSHVIMQKHVGSSTITVPIPAHKEIRTGTLPRAFEHPCPRGTFASGSLLSIIRQSGIPRNVFEKQDF